MDTSVMLSGTSTLVVILLSHRRDIYLFVIGAKKFKSTCCRALRFMQTLSSVAGTNFISELKKIIFNKIFSQYIHTQRASQLCCRLL